jgi:hypothetical protein
LNEEKFSKILTDQGGYLCVCGKKEMINGVEQNIISAIQKTKGKNNFFAHGWVGLTHALTKNGSICLNYYLVLQNKTKELP